MGLDQRTLSMLPTNFISANRVIILEQSDNMLVLATDRDASKNKENMLAFLLNSESLELRSILDHPEKRKDFDDTVQFALAHPPPTRTVGCRCVEE